MKKEDWIEFGKLMVVLLPLLLFPLAMIVIGDWLSIRLLIELAPIGLMLGVIVIAFSIEQASICLYNCGDWARYAFFSKY